MSFFRKQKPHLAKVMKLNSVGEVVPRETLVPSFPVVSDDQTKRKLDMFRYFDMCDQLGRCPSQNEWGDDDLPDGAA